MNGCLCALRFAYISSGLTVAGPTAGVIYHQENINSPAPAKSLPAYMLCTNVARHTIGGV